MPYLEGRPAVAVQQVHEIVQQLKAHEGKLPGSCAAGEDHSPAAALRQGAGPRTGGRHNALFACDERRKRV